MRDGLWTWCHWTVTSILSAEVLQIFWVILSTRCNFATQEKGGPIHGQNLLPWWTFENNQLHSWLPSGTLVLTNPSVVSDELPHDSSLAPFLTGMDFLMDGCFTDHRFIARGRDVGSQGTDTVLLQLLINIRQLSTFKPFVKILVPALEFWL